MSDNRHGRRRTSADGRSQATRAAALAVPASTWVRDEEAARLTSDQLKGWARVRHVLHTSTDVNCR